MWRDQRENLRVERFRPIKQQEINVLRQPGTQGLQGIAFTDLHQRIHASSVVHIQLHAAATHRCQGSADARCAVVWNAWTNDKNIADLGEGNHVGYICVERCDVSDRAITLSPGGEYRMSMTLSY